jgi:hypothetical protein
LIIAQYISESGSFAQGVDCHQYIESTIHIAHTACSRLTGKDEAATIEGYRKGVLVPGV